VHLSHGPQSSDWQWSGVNDNSGGRCGLAIANLLGTRRREFDDGPADFKGECLPDACSQY
jgi:hypothetical protein